MRVIIIGLVLALSAAVQAANVPVFFAGGQSNASSEWKTGIDQALIEHYGAGNYVLAYQNHPGAGMAFWVSGGQRYTHYKADFFNPGGTAGALESGVNQVISNGDTPVFAGLFWLQGETDTVSQNDADFYSYRTNLMLGFLRDDLGLDSINLSIAQIAYSDDAGFDDARLARIDKVRSVQTTIGSLEGAVAFDTAGYQRGYYVPSTDSWDYVHVHPSQRQQMGYDQASAFIQTLLTPVPEPSTALLALPAILMMRVRLRSRLSRNK